MKAEPDPRDLFEYRVTGKCLREMNKLLSFSGLLCIEEVANVTNSNFFFSFESFKVTFFLENTPYQTTQTPYFEFKYFTQIIASYDRLY